MVEGTGRDLPRRGRSGEVLPAGRGVGGRVADDPESDQEAEREGDGGGDRDDGLRMAAVQRPVEQVADSVDHDSTATPPGLDALGGSA